MLISNKKMNEKLLYYYLKLLYYLEMLTSVLEKLTPMIMFIEVLC